MGAITANVMITLNGVADRPETWQFAYSSPELHELMERQLSSATALLLGRTTYEEFARYWPTAEAAGNPLSPAMNRLKKYVVTTTLRDARWDNSEVVSGDVVSRLRSLRADPGSDLSIVGSPALVRSLLAVGLVDRLSLLVFPLVVQAGQHLFEDPAARTGLELTRCRQLPHGVLQLDYRPVAAEEERSA